MPLTILGPPTQIGGSVGGGGGGSVNSVTAADASIVVGGTAADPTITVGVITAADHGNLAGGALHANAIASGAAGFMTGADKALLDALVTLSPVNGPASSTDNALVRFDGTDGALIQNSGVIVSDGDVVSATGYVVALGLGATPSIAFSGDLNTGIWSPAADRLAFSTNAVQRFEISNTAIIATVPYVHPLGAVSAPAMTFVGDLDTGWFSPGADQVSLALAGSVRIAWAPGSMVSSPTAATSGSPTLWTFTAPAHTTLAASTEATDLNFNLARTVQFATGAITTQRAARIQGVTYGFVGASTITTASTLSIGPPVAGTNATITNPVGLFMESGATIQLDSGASLSQVALGFAADRDTGVVQTGGANTLVLATGGTARVNLAANGVVFINPAVSSGSATSFDFNMPADTTQTTATEKFFARFRGATMQRATGAVTTQRHVVVEAPTYSFAGASTITTAATFAIAAAPTAGTNATITTALAFWVQAGAARFDGNVGFFAAAPVAQQTVAAFTNNVTSGGTSDTLANYTDLVVYANDAAAIRNDLHQLGRSMAQHATALRNLGLGV